jgi:uncharacterized protein YjiS (DUF1127 family)
MKWVTLERPKIDRIACPWLIQRFIEKQPEFLYVPADKVLSTAKETGAIPYDIPGAKFSRVGEKCSFDAFIAEYKLSAPGLDKLADIVRGADTSRLDLTPQSAGLLAISRGLSRVYADDHEMLKHGMVMYDALYTWCRGTTQQVRRERSDFTIPRYLLDTIRVWRLLRRTRHELAELSDHQLEDIGLTRGQALREHSKPFWKL